MTCTHIQHYLQEKKSNWGDIKINKDTANGSIWVTLKENNSNTLAAEWRMSPSIEVLLVIQVKLFPANKMEGWHLLLGCFLLFFFFFFSTNKAVLKIWINISMWILYKVLPCRIIFPHFPHVAKRMFLWSLPAVQFKLLFNILCPGLCSLKVTDRSVCNLPLICISAKFQLLFFLFSSGPKFQVKRLKLEFAIHKWKKVNLKWPFWKECDLE